MSISILNRGASGGLTASIFVKGLLETDTVTATKDGKTLAGVWNSTESRFEIHKIKDTGTWAVAATDGDKTVTQDVQIDVIGQYSIRMFIPYYGDGSLNTVKNGYNDKILINGEVPNPLVQPYSNGNYQAYFFGYGWPTVQEYLGGVSSGVNTISRTVTGGEKGTTVAFGFGFGNTLSVAASDFRIIHNGTAKTLATLVSEQVIRPLVLIDATSPYANYIAPTPLNLYTGGSTSNSSYWGVNIFFMLNPNETITGFSFSTTKAVSEYGQGIHFATAGIDEFHISMKRE